MHKYELHAHTSECDLVAQLSGAEDRNEFTTAASSPKLPYIPPLT